MSVLAADFREGCTCEGRPCEWSSVGLTSNHTMGACVEHMSMLFFVRVRACACQCLCVWEWECVCVWERERERELLVTRKYGRLSSVTITAQDSIQYPVPFTWVPPAGWESSRSLVSQPDSGTESVNSCLSSSRENCLLAGPGPSPTPTPMVALARSPFMSCVDARVAWKGI